MTFNEVEQEEFEKLIDEYVKKHGKDALKDVYHLSKKIRKATCGTVSHLPIMEIYYYLIFDELQKEEYIKLPSVNQKAQLLHEREGISIRTTYNFFHTFYPRRIKLLKRKKL